MIDKKSIPFEDTGFFSQLVTNYLSESKSLKPFYRFAPNIDAIPAVISDVTDKFDFSRSELSAELQRQYEGFELSEATADNILQLKSAQTFTVTTAHQLNLFTGPLYVIFKISAAINLAKQLNEKYPKQHFVPVYWMGSEDHDFEEINHFRLFNNKIEWAGSQGGAVGEHKTDGILSLVDQLKERLQREPHIEEWTEMLTAAYSRPTMADAMRDLINAIFGDKGLVIVDGNTPAMKQPFQQIILDELKNSSSESIVARTNELLEAKDLKAQAHARSINLFYKRANYRVRIEREGDGFKTVDDKHAFTSEEISQEVEKHPERFSPNVILRPLHQEVVLPNVAFIGGGGELAYWMQLKDLFDHHTVSFPMLLLRPSALLMEDHHKEKLAKLNLDLMDLFQKGDQLLASRLDELNENDGIDFSEYETQIDQLFENITTQAKDIDGSLEGAVQAEKAKQLKALGNLQGRIRRAVKNNNEQQLKQIEKLHQQLFPNNSLQERTENISFFYAKYGKALIQDLIDELDAMEKTFGVLGLGFIVR